MPTAIGIDVGGTSLRVGLVREDGTILRCATRPTGFHTPCNEMLRRFHEAVEEALAAAPGQAIAGVGIGMPGLQDDQGRVASASNLPTLNGVDLRGEISRMAGAPALMENDLNAVALGEYHFGGHAIPGNLLVVAIGTGVGAAVVQGGRLLRVFRGSLGDPGHVLVEPGGPLCRCGARGCLEAHCAGWALVEQAREVGVHPESPKSKDPSPKTQDRSPKFKDQSPETQARSPKSKDPSPKTQDRSPKSKDQGPRPKVQSPKTPPRRVQSARPEAEDAGSDEVSTDAALRPRATELRPTDIFRAARQGHAGAQQVLARMAAWLGMGLASFCALYQPERIVLGGNVLVEGADAILPAAREKMRELVQPWMRDIPVQLSRISQTAGVLGGAAMVFYEH
jgi:glucokinase